MSEPIASNAPSPPISEIVPKNGFVGLFDILGYRSFLDGNDGSEQAQIGAIKSVLEDITNIEMIARNSLFSDASGGENDISFLDALFSGVKFLIFSDSILITLDLSEVSSEDPLNTELWGTSSFFLHCIYAWKEMFKKGLPLRGAITRGLYFLHGSSFAGRSIVDAHDLANNMNCAGVTVSEEVVKSLNEFMDKSKAPELNSLCFPFMVEQKKPDKKKHSILNIAHGISFSDRRPPLKWTNDITQLVHESFWKHNKSIGPGVPEKIASTVRMFRFLKMKHPEGFFTENDETG